MLVKGTKDKLHWVASAVQLSRDKLDNTSVCRLAHSFPYGEREFHICGKLGLHFAHKQVCYTHIFLLNDFLK